MFLYFLINVHPQIKKWITKSDWSHTMVEWKLAWRLYQMLNVELETFINILVIWASVWLVFLFLHFRMFSFGETKKKFSISKT